MNNYFTLLGAFTLGILIRHAYNYFKDKEAFDWQDNLAESIVSVIVSAILSAFILLCVEYPLVLWVTGAVVGVFAKKLIEKANKWHGELN